MNNLTVSKIRISEAKATCLHVAEREYLRQRQRYELNWSGIPFPYIFSDIKHKKPAGNVPAGKSSADRTTDSPKDKSIQELQQ